MSQAIAIIGAGYGDECKGMATDYFTRALRAPMVARCNGGAQAGHTVVDGEKRHVFSHVGSGAFAGASTYLASQFIVNPLSLHKELKKLNQHQRIYASGDCRVTTLYDMAINSLIELKRGGDRHGSCGQGINETVTRHDAGFFLTLDTVNKQSFNFLCERIEKIRYKWVPMRMLKLGIWRDADFEDNAKIYFDILAMSPTTIAEGLMHHGELIKMYDPKELMEFDDTLVVEGAQGLMLDEFLGEFPYVTRSITGLASSIRAAAECGKTSITPIYMSRVYLTRHGAGPLPYSSIAPTNRDLVDNTNVDNQWQGTLRYSPLDLKSLKWYIKADLERGRTAGQIFGVEVKKPKLFLTCMDQLGTMVTIVNEHGKIVELEVKNLITTIEKSLEIPVYAASFGPSASDVLLLGHVL